MQEDLVPPAPPVSRRRLLQSATLTAAAVGVGLDVPTASAAAPKPATSGLSPSLPLVSDQAWHLARRAAIGADARIAAKITSMGAKAWVDWQLKPSSVPDKVCDALLDQHMPWLKLTTPQLRDATNGDTWKGATVLVRSLELRHIFSERVLLESVVETMADQVFVSAVGKSESWVLDWDRTVIRRHALGKFSSLLKAALVHPALLVYLDNDASTKRSPNENLGRELLELHTVGVGQYTEADVRQSALLLTGHTFDWKTLTYKFKPENHYVGPLKIMGFKHPNAKASDGPAVLAAYADYLATRKSTAKRICRRLAVRYVSDSPSDGLVDDLASVYQSSKTNISSVVRALFAHPEFKASVGKKWRRPQEWAASGVRATLPTWKPTGTQNDPWTLLSYHGWMLDGAQHEPRRWPAVNGYPDQSGYWMSTNGMLAAWNHAEAIASHWDKELLFTAWPDMFDIKVGQNVWTLAAAMTKTLTGYTWRREDLTVVASMLAGGAKSVPADGYTLTAGNVKWDYAEAVRMIFASPYFLIR